jgi:hypothetical protein
VTQSRAALFDTRLVSRFGIPAVVGGASVLALVAALQKDAALAVAGVAALIVLAIALPLEVIVSLVVIASFFSRITVSVAGFHVRPEHVMTGLLLCKIVLTSRNGFRLSRSATRAVLAMAALVALNLVATVLNSPQISSSLNVLGWLTLDLVLLWSLVQVPERMLRRAVLRTGLTCASIMAVAALAVWIVAVAGGPLLGVDSTATGGGLAAYVTSFEPNIAAGELVLWGLVALASLASGEGPTLIAKVAALLCPLALIATDTRAAIVAYIVAAGILTVRGGIIRLRHVLLGAVLVLMALFVLSIGGQSSPLYGTSQKLNNLSLSSSDAVLRTQSWSIAWHDMGEEQIVLGLGTNSYGQRHYDPTLPGLNAPGYLSSLPFQVVYDGGGLAVLAILALFSAALPRQRRARSLAFAMAAAYLIISTATSPFWFSFTWIFLALGVLQRDLPDAAPPAMEVAVSRQTPVAGKSSGV